VKGIDALADLFDVLADTVWNSAATNTPTLTVYTSARNVYTLLIPVTQIPNRHQVKQNTHGMVLKASYICVI